MLPLQDNQEVKIWVKEEASGEESSSTDLKTKLLGERRDSSSDRCARIPSSFGPLHFTLRVTMQDCVSAADSHVCLVAHEVDLLLQGAAATIRSNIH